MVIQHNVTAINSHRGLLINNSKSAQNLEKLSSGFRINRAGDDAAGLAISEKMRGQIRGLSRAEQNAAHGINLIQTAEGGLNETHSILQRMRELAVQSSNGTYQDSDREQLTLEFSALKEEIDRIADSTHYNGIRLLNGMREPEPEMPKPPASAAVIANGTILSGTITNDIVIQSGTTVGMMSNLVINAGVQVWVMEGATLETGFPGPGGSNMFNMGTIYNKGTINNERLAINNRVDVSTGDMGKVINYSQGIITNEVAASAYPPSGSVYQPDVKATSIINYGSMFMVSNWYNSTTVNYGKINYAGNSGDGSLYNYGVISHMFQNTDNNINGDVAKIENYGTIGAIVDEDPDYLTGEINFGTPDLTLQIGANGSIDQQIKVVLRMMGTLHIGIQAPDNNNRWLNDEWGEHFKHGHNVFEATIDDISIDTIDNANYAINVIDAAVNQVSDQRASLGATQNRLEHTLNNLGVTKENLTAAESVIRDADMAKEMMDFTKNSILSQSAQAMLAQANQLPQGVLSLLR